jgi:hypothetical protein
VPDPSDGVGCESGLLFLPDKLLDVLCRQLLELDRPERWDHVEANEPFIRLVGSNPPGLPEIQELLAVSPLSADRFDGVASRVPENRGAM